MKLHNFPFIGVAFFAILLTVASLQAHSVYIESDKDGKLILRFGEFGSDPETSPGFLDSLDEITAWHWPDGAQPAAIELTKGKDRFSTGVPRTEGIQAETGFPIMTRGGSPPRKPFFYARWIPSLDAKGEPALTLDIVPTGTPGEARVVFRNKPLAGVTVTRYTPEANDKELTSDENGVIRFQSDEKGLHMVKVGRYREDRAGFDRGGLHELVGHNCSLTWVQD